MLDPYIFTQSLIQYDIIFIGLFNVMFCLNSTDKTIKTNKNYS